MALDFPSSPVDGQVYDNYVYSSAISAWRASNSNQTFPVPIGNGGTGALTLGQAQDNLGVGLVRMIPATVQYSGGAATANTAGMITYSAVTSLSLNQVFGSFRNYRILITGTSSTTAGLLFRFRSNGSDFSSTVHDRQVFTANGSTLTGGRATGEAQWEIGVLLTQHQIVMDLYNPNSTGNKNFQSFTVRATGASTNVYWESGYAGTTSAYDSFTIYPSTGNISGEIVVYGYNE